MRTSFIRQTHPVGKRQITVFAGIFAVIGAMAIILVFASGAGVSFLVADGTVSGSATKVSNASAVGGQMVVFGVAAPPTPAPTSTPAPTPTPIQTPVPSGWPNASSAGYQVAPGYPGSLHSCGSSVASNTTYQYCDFSGGLYIGNSSTHPTNISFYGCRFASNALADANVAIYGDNISFDYVTFEPSAAAAPPVAYNKGYQYGIDQRYAGAVTINHANIWGWGNGIQIDSSTQAKPFVVRNSWFHDARADGGIDHTDAILENYGGQAYMVFDHNTIASVGNTNGLALQAGNHVNYDHLIVTNNYFSGFGYTVNIGGGGYLSNSTFTDNTFGTDFQPVFGPLYGWGGNASSNNLWRRNKWHVAAGTSWSAAINDGRYWLPSGSTSTTDYAGS